MTGSRYSCRTYLAMLARLVFRALAALLLVLSAGPALATAPDSREWVPLDSLCHAVVGRLNEPADHRIPAHFSCEGLPQGYQHGSLWLTAGPEIVRRAGDTPVLMVHSTRLDRLIVGFGYADGTTEWQDVRSGDYGSHWRLGGQISFEPVQRDVPITRIYLRFDRVASAEMLRIRLVPEGPSHLQATALASMIGAALMLLAVGALYNLGLAIAARRQFPAWQSAWAACMVVWGAMWSQFHLFFFPGLAGAVSAQACTTLSGLALALATFSLLTAIDKADLPQWLRRLTAGMALSCALASIPLGLVRSGPMELWAALLGVMVISLLALAASCLAVAWRRGSRAARAFVGAWVVPMAVMGFSGFVNTDSLFWGGGSQMLVLVSASWQTLWLSVAATRRFTQLRLERDRALAAEAAAQEQARRDPLTGLRNRRGFVDRIAPALARVADARPDHPLDDGDSVALMVLDVDRFKNINDTYGHEAGDAVLVTLARRLERWDEGMCVVARLGGEEFAILASGMGRFAVLTLAESVRAGLAACDHAAVLGGKAVTVSIGVAMAHAGDDFSAIYRTADAALYAAKHQGRNCVVMAPDVDSGPFAPAAQANRSISVE